MRIAMAAAAALFVLGACGGAGAPAAQSGATQATVKTADDAKLGKILVASTGMTLYVWDKDSKDTANCYDACAQNWPPLTIGSGDPTGAGISGKLATTTRKDGAKQVTLNGQPLYFYAKDTKAGDTTGDGVGGTWHVVKNP